MPAFGSLTKGQFHMQTYDYDPRRSACSYYTTGHTCFVALHDLSVETSKTFSIYICIHKSSHILARSYVG